MIINQILPQTLVYLQQLISPKVKNGITLQQSI